jgi:hypothetical protein
MDDDVKSKLLTVIASIFLVAFAGIWLYVACKTFRFEPTDAHKTLTFGNGLVAVAGLIASTVTAGTAAVLGIEVQKSSAPTAAARLTEATAASRIIWVGILVYLVVGILNLWAWLANETIAPEMVGVFGMSVLGWLAGAFLAVFKAE